MNLEQECNQCCAIDLLIHQSEIELINTQATYNNEYMVLNVLFNEQNPPKPSDFMSKFLRGKD